MKFEFRARNSKFDSQTVQKPMDKLKSTAKQVKKPMDKSTEGCKTVQKPMDKLKSTAEPSKKPWVFGGSAEVGPKNHGFYSVSGGGRRRLAPDRPRTSAGPASDRPRNGFALGAGKMVNLGKIMPKPMVFASCCASVIDPPVYFCFCQFALGQFCLIKSS